MEGEAVEAHVLKVTPLPGYTLNISLTIPPHITLTLPIPLIYPLIYP